MGLPTLSPHQETFSAPPGLWPTPAVCAHATIPKSKRAEGRCASGPGLATQVGLGLLGQKLSIAIAHLFIFPSCLTPFSHVLEKGANVLCPSTRRGHSLLGTVLNWATRGRSCCVTELRSPDHLLSACDSSPQRVPVISGWGVLP